MSESTSGSAKILVHFVRDETYPFGLNIHTHGIRENWSQRDLQIVFPVDVDTANNLFISAVKAMADGEVFDDGDEIDCDRGGEIIGVRLVSAVESQRQVLRMILPDHSGKNRFSDMDETFNRQFLGRYKMDEL